MRPKRQGDIIQFMGLSLVTVGLLVELACKAHWLFFIVTFGSLTFAVGTKLKGR